jgi:hypothetical protein
VAKGYIRNMGQTAAEQLVVPLACDRVDLDREAKNADDLFVFWQSPGTDGTLSKPEVVLVVLGGVESSECRPRFVGRISSQERVEI